MAGGQDPVVARQAITCLARTRPIRTAIYLLAPMPCIPMGIFTLARMSAPVLTAMLDAIPMETWHPAPTRPTRGATYLPAPIPCTLTVILCLTDNLI